MRQFYIDCINELLSANNCNETYQKLEEHFESCADFDNYYLVLLARAYISDKADLFIKAADVAENLLGDKNKAQECYNRYFERISKEHFKKYIKLLMECNDNLKPIIYDEYDIYSNDKAILSLLFLHSIITGIMKNLLNAKDYQAVIDFSEYLQIAKDKILSYIEENQDNSTDCLLPLSEIKKYKENEEMLSNLISKVERHNDLNNLAICLDQTNETAFFNLIEDSIYTNDFNSVLNIYNDLYCVVFNKEKKSNVADIIHELSNIYSQRYHFYKAVFFEKKALEIELGEN